ncbi:DUF927 domain-containing protein [Gimesia sp.]|uniref:DUF927 domain-containing protein n=1 Tax=Gimesia sp. TaxID=2024833 RepID=UPI003A91DB61
MKIDGKIESITLEKLRNPDYTHQLSGRITSALKSTNVDLSKLSDLAPKFRLELFLFLSPLTKYVKYRISKNNGFQTNLFEATLELICGNQDMSGHQNTKMAAIEAAVLEYPEVLDSACDRIAKRLTELNIKGVNRRELLKQAKDILNQLETLYATDTDNQSGCFIRELVPDVPIPNNLQVPNGWNLSKKGISRHNQKISIPIPILISAKVINLQDDTVLISLMWFQNEMWKVHTFEKSKIANQRTIVDELAPLGILVTSNNSKDLVQYLLDFEVENQDILPIEYTTHQLGWMRNNVPEGFLLGHKFIFPKSPEKADNHSSEPKNKVQFKGMDEGDNQIAAAFEAKGSFEQWLAVIESVLHHPQVMLAIFSSLAAPLLNIFHSPGFVVSFSGQTSSGKTSTLRIGASCWGNPNEVESNSIIKSWRSTATSRERLPAILKNLPLILDDTKLAIRNEDVATTIYSIVAGMGKGRGSVKGLAKQLTWQTILLTSGEQPLTSFTQDAGTRARVLSLWGSPFGDSSPNTGVLVRDCSEIISSNYGHAGKRFIQHILDNRCQWDAWITEYKYEVDKFQEWASHAGNPFAARMAPHFAAIATTAWLAHDALGLPGEYSDPIEPLWEELSGAAQEADQAVSAMRFMIDWFQSHPNDFLGKNTNEKNQPNNGWAGVYRKISPQPAEEEISNGKIAYIAFFPSKLKELLIQHRFEPTGILRKWRDKGWLSIDPSSTGRFTKKVKKPDGSGSVNLITINQNAINESGAE